MQTCGGAEQKRTQGISIIHVVLGYGQLHQPLAVNATQDFLIGRPQKKKGPAAADLTRHMQLCTNRYSSDSFPGSRAWGRRIVAQERKSLPCSMISAPRRLLVVFWVYRERDTRGIEERFNVSYC